MQSRMLPVLLTALLCPAVSEAQGDSKWGIVASVTPSQSWKVDSTLSEYIFEHEGKADISGTDFSIGIARGRTLGGDWGVSFVRRSLDDGARFESFTGLCLDNGSCTDELDEYYLTRGVTFTGVEAHKFIPFVTIARRVQLGMNVAGGIGTFSGNLEKHDFEFDFQLVNNQLQMRQVETVSIEPAEDFVSLSPFPLGKVEAAVAVIAAPGLKIRASGGFNFPGYSVFRITGVYLFGAN